MIIIEKYTKINGNRSEPIVFYIEVKDKNELENLRNILQENNKYKIMFIYKEK